MRFVATCYRAHDPRWAFKPISGDGAAIRGGRFNPKGVPALYLSLSIMTAIKEANQGFAHRIDPCVLCSYDIDCADIADLTTDKGREAFAVARDDLASPWALEISDGQRPRSWGSMIDCASRVSPASWCRVSRLGPRLRTGTSYCGNGARTCRTK